MRWDWKQWAQFLTTFAAVTALTHLGDWRCVAVAIVWVLASNSLAFSQGMHESHRRQS